MDSHREAVQYADCGLAISDFRASMFIVWVLQYDGMPFRHARRDGSVG